MSAPLTLNKFVPRMDSGQVQAQRSCITGQGSAYRRRWLRDQLRSRLRQRERAMPQPHQPFNYIPPAYITPITCPYCGGSAPIVRRTPHPAVKGELRTFECRECLKQTEMTVKD